MGSSRLPGKVLMPLGNTVVLDYVVSRCRQIKEISDVIVATSTLEHDNTIESWCMQNHVTCFRGSEDDVLARYYECALPLRPDYVIRVTADCPFVDFDLGSEMVEKMRVAPADFIRISGSLPRGLAVELFSYQSLEYMNEHGQEHRHREHVTYYAYEHPEEFSWTSVKPDDTIQQPQLRITLDTEEDYQLCQAIANHFQGDKLVSVEQIVQYLLDHPEIATLNAHIKQKPVV